MINSDNKQAFLILTNVLSKKIIKNYRAIAEATAHLGDVFLLYHTDNSNSIPAVPEGVLIETFTNDILHNLSYKPIQKKLVPGSNHFPVLDFFLKHPDYNYYWCLEDDVAFNGNWADFFEEVSANYNYDFIASHIKRYSDEPTWFWWNTFTLPEGEFNKEDLLKSFNPIYRISNKALQHIDTYLKKGYVGHHEVLLPSVLKRDGFTIADFSSKENFVTPLLSFCTRGTMRWKPIFLAVGNNKNKLYHPVKLKVTLNQVLFYIRKVVRNPKKYLT